MKKCRLLISDSGGVQEEASFFNKRVIVCRKVTERTESIGTHSFLCDKPSSLNSLFEELVYDYEINKPCPYGDGNSSEKIIEILKKL